MMNIYPKNNKGFVSKLNNINSLLKTKRIEEYDDQNGANRLYGLNDLCERFIKSDYTVLEIGSFAGVSSALLANYCKNLICVDPWSPYEEIQHDLVLNSEKLFDEVKEKYNNITKLKMTSEEATFLYEDESLDGVYIDGLHTMQGVQSDILYWLPKIKQGGFISGHDYSYIIYVKLVVDQLFKGYKIHTFSDSSWLVEITEDLTKDIKKIYNSAIKIIKK